MNSGLISHTKASEMASIYARNTVAIIDKLREIRDLRDELKSVFYDTGAFDFTIESWKIDDGELQELATMFKRHGWRTLIEKLELRKYMSSKKQEELDNTLYERKRYGQDDDPINEFPEITEDSIMEVIAGYIHTVPEFMDEAIREEWDYWIPKRDEYKTNAEKWKVSKKIIQPWIMRPWDKWDSCHNIRYDARKHVSNLDNIFHLLDGKGFIATNTGPLVDAIDRNRTGSAETEYFKAKMFKNGNLHLWVKRLDLLDKFNEIGCGEGTSLPNAVNTPSHGMDKPSSLDNEVKPTCADLNFFATPKPVVDRIVSIAIEHFGSEDLRHRKVLEPSAGEGAIAKACYEQRARVYCIEINPKMAAELDKNSDYHGCECMDFLDKQPTPALDAVIMNPPFSNNRDIRHVYHAHKFVKRGGILIAVMSNHWRFASDNLSQDFRKWVDDLDYDWTELPSGSFRQSGTMVECGLLVIKRPTLERVQAAAIEKPTRSIQPMLC